MFPGRARIEVYEFGQFRLDLVVRQLFHQGQPVPLSPRTFDILQILVENRGQIVTKDELLRRVWPDRFVEENNLTVRVSALRKTLAEGLANRFIETERGSGYRFVARAREVCGESEGRYRKAFDSLAVLPLINEQKLQKLNYICDGVTEGLIASLSHVANLRVMARSTVFRYKGSDTAPQAIGKELDVRAVLVGRVYQAADSLVFDMEIIDAEDGAYIWGAKYKSQGRDLLPLPEEITRAVSESLRIKLTEGEENKVARRDTSSPEAHHLYLKGRYFWNKRSVAGLKQAVKCFSSAIRHDPHYALAYAGIADSYIILSSYGLQPPRATMPKARTAALKALAFDDQLAEAHVSLGNIKSAFEYDWSGAESEFKQALALNPDYTLARQCYAMFLAKIGRLDQALAEMTKAHEVDPLSPAINLALGKIYYFAGRHQEAVSKAREILELEPNFRLSHGLLGIAYAELGLYAEAIKEFRKIIEFTAGDYQIRSASGQSSVQKSEYPACDPEALAFLGYIYALWGKRKKALHLVNTLVELSKERYVQPHAPAFIFIGLGDHDQAFAWLEQAFAHKSNALTYIQSWPLFLRLKNDPRYEQLVRRMGL
jgi:DNA-binding winged helix-turn-helix (wHTH) protein/Flp pilus assembly protein TadD